MKKVKLCGLFRQEDVEAVNEIRPDYCGFVICFPKSHRSVSLNQLRELRSLLCPEVQPVGVFVNQPEEFVASLLEDGTLSCAQLHGTESRGYISRLRQLTDKPIWQAVQIRCPEDVRRAAESTADFVLLDAGQGEGKTFSWELLNGFPRPFGLAGGLNEENLPLALQTGAVLFDVSGGVETGKKKDPEKMRKFAAMVRSMGGEEPDRKEPR